MWMICSLVAKSEEMLMQLFNNIAVTLTNQGGETVSELKLRGRFFVVGLVSVLDVTLNGH